MARRATRTANHRRDAPPRRRGAIVGVAIAASVVVAVLIWVARSPSRPEPEDEAAEALSRGQAARAERALIRSCRLDPLDPEPWVVRLEILCVEDRRIEAQKVGWRAYQDVGQRDRRRVLRAFTLALLADASDDLARSTLARWVEADPQDVAAQVALIQRIAASPRAGDPDRAARIAALSRIVSAHPEHVEAREALVLALADAGEPDRGRSVLGAWPEASRDARYHRLRGRWDLEYDHAPARAVESFRASLEELPQDWRTCYRLARALRNAGKHAEANRAAEAVERLREALDPLAMGHRLDRDLADLDDAKSRLDLADLCERAGLKRLAEAWRRDAEMPATDPLRRP